MTREEMLKDDFVANHYGDRARNWVDPAFIDGVNWMEERMQESNEGQALLYAIEKTAERTKREMIKKAVEWLSNNMFHSINNGVQINGTCISDFIERFKKAMQDESRRLD